MMPCKRKEVPEWLSVILCSFLLHTGTIVAGQSCSSSLLPITSDGGGSAWTITLLFYGLYSVSQGCVQP